MWITRILVSDQYSYAWYKKGSSQRQSKIGMIIIFRTVKGIGRERARARAAQLSQNKYLQTTVENVSQHYELQVTAMTIE